MVEPLRHRQTKGAETDMPSLPPPRHIPTLPTAAIHLVEPTVALRISEGAAPSNSGLSLTRIFKALAIS